MKQLTFIISLFFMAITANAGDYKYLILESNDGTTYSMTAQGLTLTFKDGNLVSTDGTTIPLSSLAKMYFSDASGISTLSNTTDESQVIIYTISGSVAGIYNDLSSAVANLTKGVYIIKKNDGSIIKYLAK